MPLNEYTWLIKGFYELVLGTFSLSFYFRDPTIADWIYQANQKEPRITFVPFMIDLVKLGKRNFFLEHLSDL